MMTALLGERGQARLPDLRLHSQLNYSHIESLSIREQTLNSESALGQEGGLAPLLVFPWVRS